MGMGISERMADETEVIKRAMENFGANMRVAIPGIIIDFDPALQTATVQPAVRERAAIDGQRQNMDLPALPDVPVCFPKGGGCSISFPLQAGDECLVVFADMCIDAWWQSGGVQNQAEWRRHDLSDAFAIPGVSSVPRAIAPFPGDALCRRNGGAEIELKPGSVNIRAGSIKINGTEFSGHRHTTSGGGITGWII